MEDVVEDCFEVAIKEVHGKSRSRPERHARSGRGDEKKDGRQLALLTTLVGSSVRRDGARWSG